MVPSTSTRSTMKNSKKMASTRTSWLSVSIYIIRCYSIVSMIVYSSLDHMVRKEHLNNGVHLDEN